jgi:hypothetical protein
MCTLDTIQFLQKNVKKNENVYISAATLSVFDTFLWNKTRNVFPLMYDYCWLDESKKNVCNNSEWKNTVKDLTNSSKVDWIAVVDSMQFELLGGDPFVHIINYSNDLDNLFKRVFSICYPNEEYNEGICSFNNGHDCESPDDRSCCIVYKVSSNN